MNKQHIIKTIQQAKPEHMDWIKQGHKILQGEAQEHLKKPVECTACNFGQWYYEEGNKLVNIPQLIELEALHKEIHQSYTALYYMTFDRRKKARSTIITANREIPVDEKCFRQKKLKQLEKKTVKMILALGAIEKKVAAMQDKDFESGWFV
jgi:hypothetical protein